MVPSSRFDVCLRVLLLLLYGSATLGYANATGYYMLKPAAPLSGSPSGLALQSTFVNMPAGGVFTLHLLKGHQLVASSRLQFSTAYQSSSFLPMRIAAFVPTGTTPGMSEPIPGATLTEGVADLAALAANPEQYQFLWTLSDGIIAPPGQAILTGSGVTFVEFALSGGIAALRQSDQKPGSVLFYQRYQSSLTNPNAENATLSLTNTSPTDSTKVRLFFINAADCQPYEQAVCLGPQQSVRFVMSEFDPLTTGYCVAVACDATGAPTQFNWLIGHLQLRQPSPVGQLFDTSLSALAVAKRTPGALAVSQSKAEMAFDDEMYDRLPNQLAADNVPSQAGTGSNALATRLTLYRPVANLAGGSTSVPVTFTAFNETGQSSAAAQPVSCFGDVRLSTLRFSPALATVLAVGRSGWVRIATNDQSPMLGAQFTSGSYVSGAALRAISYATDYRISVPIKVPGC